jgi:hypothetical protein
MGVEPTTADSPHKPGFFKFPNKGVSNPPEKLSGWALLKIATIRAIPVTLFVTIHDPLVRVVLLALCVLAVILGIFNILSKRSDGLKEFAKAAVYAIGATAITVGIANDRAQADVLVSKLEEYKQQQGSYPERLDDLVPNTLPNISSIGLGRPIYGKEADSYLLAYRVSWENNCSYRPASGSWTCRGMR